ncbi:hypothetical protein SDC9_104343 [bioreactor metagenome]|uniref:Uncharacterized protein n=1 Tax=bioreactor metagenome TaxID=1076179 RepID=A0A645AYW9_9ZZZZ
METDNELLRLKSQVWNIVFGGYLEHRIFYTSTYEQHVNPFNKLFKSPWIYYFSFINEYAGSENVNDIMDEFNIFLDKFDIKIDATEYEKLFSVIYQSQIDNKFGNFKRLYIMQAPNWLKDYGEDYSSKDITEEDAFYDVQMLDKYYKCKYHYKELYAVLHYLSKHKNEKCIDASTLWIRANHNIETPDMYQENFYCWDNKYFYIFKSVYNKHFNNKDIIKNIFFSNDYKKSIAILHEFIQAFLK